jgi:hypothetical protein
MNKVYLVWEHYSTYEGSWDFLVNIYDCLDVADLVATEKELEFLEKHLDEERSWWVEEQEVSSKNSKTDCHPRFCDVFL